MSARQPVRTNTSQRLMSALDSSLRAAAEGIERLHDGLSPPSPELSGEDEIDGVYDSRLARIVDGFRAQLKRGDPFQLPLHKLYAILDALVNAKLEGGIDDRKYLLEHGLTFLSRYPADTVTAKELQDKVIALLWYDLAHPPASVVGSKYQFRTADGSGTSIWHPDMGKAGTPYARSVQGRYPLAKNQLPHPGLLFDALLKREDGEAPHPAGLSTFFFAFANLVIHSLFWTTFEDPDDKKHKKGKKGDSSSSSSSSSSDSSSDSSSSEDESDSKKEKKKAKKEEKMKAKMEKEEDFSQPINKVSSYLDLSPLYGSSEKEVNSIRLKDGTGRIYPDTFADPRVLRMPPSTPALLVMFSRNHNYIAEKLLEINERGRWHNPPPGDKKARRKQDDEIFGTARLVNCGWFMSTIFGDYLASILGLVREGNSWSLDPLSNFREASHEIVERGSGNIVSIEFLALYHFHSSIGTKDAEWVEDEMFKHFATRDWDSITVKQYRDFIRKSADPKNPRNSIPPNKWPLSTDPMKYPRGEDGRFKDEDLAKILHDATAQSANAFKARGTPHVMRVIEMMGITLNREWGTCSLNEFRKFLNLKPYKTFEEWNPRQDIADAARRLYRHPDNIELYVGLQAEQSKKKMPGAGLCPGFTMSRAILADAVALVRGDRFLTNDFTAYNLTAWGIQDCTRDPKNSSHGGMMGKLLTRCLPDYFPVDSVYTNFPFVVPSSMMGFLADVNKAHLYTDHPPVANKTLEPLKGYYEVVDALKQKELASTVPQNAEIVLPGGGYLTSYNEARNAADKKLIAEAFLPSQKKHFDFLEKTTAKLLREKSYTLTNGKKRSLNIVRDVINLLPVYLISEHVLGLPLKTSTNTGGNDVEQEAYLKFKEVYDFIFIDLAEPSTKVAKRESMTVFSQYFQDIVQGHIQSLASEQIPVLGLAASAYHGMTQEHYESHEWLKRLLIAGRGKTKEELGNDATALAIALFEFAQALTHVVDQFLAPNETPASVSNPDKASHVDQSPLADFKALDLNSSDKAATTKLEEAITKALRIRPPVPGTYRKKPVPQKATESGGEAPHERVYLSFTEAGVDASVWGPKTSETNTSANASTQPPPQPLFAGEIVRLLGSEWLLQAIVPVVKTIFKLKDLKRAPGNSGNLLSFNDVIEGTPATTYLNYKQEPTFWSSDLTVTYTS